VGAQSAFPHLSSREKIYKLPLDLEEKQPDYLIFAKKELDRWPFDRKDKSLNEYIKKAKEEYGYQPVLEENEIVLLKNS
jgi:Skp family chaperone for outer membrane proteins